MNFEIIIGTKYCKTTLDGTTYYLRVEVLPNLAEEILFRDTRFVGNRLMFVADYATRNNVFIKCRSDVNEVLETFLKQGKW